MSIKHHGQVLIDRYELLKWTLVEQLNSTGVTQQIAERPVRVMREDQRVREPALVRSVQALTTQVAENSRQHTVTMFTTAMRT